MDASRTCTRLQLCERPPLLLLFLGWRRRRRDLVRLRGRKGREGSAALPAGSSISPARPTSGVVSTPFPTCSHGLVASPKLLCPRDPNQHEMHLSVYSIPRTGTPG